MHAATQEYLADLLVRRGVLPADQRDNLIATAVERGTDITELVVATDVTTETRIAEAFAEELGIGYMSEIDVNADRGQVQARRLLKRLIAAEAEQGPST